MDANRRAIKKPHQFDCDAKNEIMMEETPLRENGQLEMGYATLLNHHNPVDIEFKNVEYSISEGRLCRKKEQKPLLKGVSGTFKRGELVALMGPSGAGKTSLMHILAGYKNPTNGVINTAISGRNFTIRDSRLFRQLSCYIMQYDELLPTLTVMECMIVAARIFTLCYFLICLTKFFISLHNSCIRAIS